MPSTPQPRGGRFAGVAVVAAVVSVLGAAASLVPPILRARHEAELVSRRPGPASAVRRPLVMCLGDSLTDFGYPAELGRLLGPGVRVSNEGVSGENTAQLLGRWRNGLLPARPDALVVLGGVNDLQRGAGLAAPAVANLETVYAEALQAGAQVVAVTLPPFEGAEGWSPEVERERQRVNAFILERCRAGDRLRCADAGAALAGEDGRLAKAYDSGDHLHLSQAGRERLAALVAEALRAAGGVPR